MTDKATTVTPERRGQGKIILTERETKLGGELGQQDVWAFYPDFLAEQQLLGDEQEAARRRNAAFAFRKLWAQTHRSEKSNIRDAAAAGQPGERPTQQAETDTDAAKRETEWLLVQKYLGAHRIEVEWICLERQAPAYPISLDGVPELRKSENPDDWKLAADLVKKRQSQQALINAHIFAFNAKRSGAVLDALDALEGALQRAREKAWKENP
jgi:hypothetical protein